MITSVSSKVLKTRKSNAFLNVECDWDDKESVSKYITRVDRTAQKMIATQDFETALALLGQALKDLQTMCHKTHHALEMKLHVTKAQLYTERNDFQQAVDALKAANKLTDHKSCKPIQKCEVLLNLARTCNHLGFKYESITYSAQAVKSLKDYENINELDLLVQSLILSATLLEQDYQYEEALNQFKQAQSLLSSNFNDQHFNLENCNSAVKRLQSIYDQVSQVKVKRGRITKVYLKETDEIQQQDLRETISEQGHVCTPQCGNHCMIHSNERNYQAQLLQMRAMMDEKFRIEQLLIMQTCYPREQKQQVQRQRAQSTTSSSSSTSSMSSESEQIIEPEQETVQQVQVDSSSDEDQEWIDTFAYQIETKIEAKIKKIACEPIVNTFTQSPHVPAIITCGTKNNEQEQIAKAKNSKQIELIQKLLRSWIERVRLRKLKKTENFFLRFYMNCGGNVARVTVQKVLLKATKYRHVEKHVDHKIEQETTEVTGVRMVEGYQIIIQNKADLDEKFEKILNNEQLPNRKVLTEYLKAAIVLTWEEKTLVSYKFNLLTEEQEIEVMAQHQAYLDKIRNVGTNFVSKLQDYSAATKINEQVVLRSETKITDDRSLIQAAEVTDELLEKVKKQAFALAMSADVTKDEHRKLIEFQARQVMSRGPKSRTIYRLVNDANEVDVRVIKLNRFNKVGPVVKASLPQKIPINLIIKLQAIIRGFLQRNNKQPQLIGSFIQDQNEKEYQVKVYKSQKMILITVTHQKQQMRKQFDLKGNVMQIVQRNLKIYDDDFDLTNVDDSSDEEQPPEYQMIGGQMIKVDTHKYMLAKMIKTRKFIFEFEFDRNGSYRGKYLKYLNQLVIVVWRLSDPTDCDYLVLSGVRSEFQQPCCCDKCCKACARCGQAVFCCMACLKNKQLSQSCCQRIQHNYNDVESNKIRVSQVVVESNKATSKSIAKSRARKPVQNIQVAPNQPQRENCCKQAVCNPCDTCSNCLDALGLAVCGCPQNTVNCCKNLGSCLQKSAKLLFCGIPKCLCCTVPKCICGSVKQCAQSCCKCCKESNQNCKTKCVKCNTDCSENCKNSNCTNCACCTKDGCHKSALTCVQCTTRTNNQCCAGSSDKCKVKCTKCCSKLLCCCLKPQPKVKEFKIKLKDKQLQDFIVENLLVYKNEGKIAYIALNNKDRLSKPGKVLSCFQFERCVVRMLIYKKSMKLTVHKIGDTTDKAKLDWNKITILNAVDLDRFLRQHLKIIQESDSITKLVIKNDKGLFEHVLDDRLITKVQAMFRMHMWRKRYLCYMREKLCIYYERSGSSRAMIVVKKVQLKKTNTHKKIKTEKEGLQKIDEQIVKEETITMVEGYQIIAVVRDHQCGNKFSSWVDLVQQLRYCCNNGGNQVEKIITEKMPKFPIDYLRQAVSVEWEAGKVSKIHFQKLEQSHVSKISTEYRSLARTQWGVVTSWKVLYTHEKDGTYILSQADVGTLQQPYLQVVFKTSQRKYQWIITLQDAAIILRINPRQSLEDLKELCDYSNNIESYAKIIQCFEITHCGDMRFLTATFNKLRFGFSGSAVREQLTEDAAARMLQRAVRRWIKRRQYKKLRRQNGMKSITGVLRTSNFCLVYVLLAHTNKYTITVKEKNKAITLVSKHQVQQKTVNDLKGYNNVLQGIEKVFLDKVRDVQDLRDIANKITTI